MEQIFAASTEELAKLSLQELTNEEQVTTTGGDFLEELGRILREMIK